jgi:ketosteroid isomerase-like protein
MSQDNVDRFIQATEAFNRLTEAPEAFNPRALQDFLGLMDPEVQFEPQQAALQGGYVGHEGVMHWLADLAQHYKGGHLHCADVRELGELVLALGTLRVIGRGSGIEAEAPVAIVARFREGLITHFKDYGDKDPALEAAGLSG